MQPSVDLHMWAGRLCLGLVGMLAMLGYYFANVRFIPVAMGFAILAGVCYWAGRAGPPAAAPSLSHSGRHRAL